MQAILDHIPKEKVRIKVKRIRMIRKYYYILTILKMGSNKIICNQVLSTSIKWNRVLSISVRRYNPPHRKNNQHPKFNKLDNSKNNNKRSRLSKIISLNQNNLRLKLIKNRYQMIKHDEYIPVSKDLVM